jgi:hypothetical protein
VRRMEVMVTCPRGVDRKRCIWLAVRFGGEPYD